LEAGFTVKSQVVWDKMTHGMGDLDGAFGPQHELMIYATKGSYKFRGERPKTIYRCPRAAPEKLIHPNEKPVDLLRAIIRDLTVKGETIVDPFGGSFNTAVAAYKEGRRCVSWELMEDYYNKGKKNFDQQTAKQTLF
jgi:DNA modification methylase